MRPADKERFQRVISTLARTFRVEPDPLMLEGYWIGLEDQSIEGVETAVRSLLKKAEFMPAPAVILRESERTHRSKRLRLRSPDEIFADPKEAKPCP